MMKLGCKITVTAGTYDRKFTGDVTVTFPEGWDSLAVENFLGMVGREGKTRKVATIRVVRALLGIGLKEAKWFVDNVVDHFEQNDDDFSIFTH